MNTILHVRLFWRMDMHTHCVAPNVTIAIPEFSMSPSLLYFNALPINKKIVTLPRIAALDKYCSPSTGSHLRNNKNVPRRKKRACSKPNCNKISRRLGFCFKHGGKVYCKVANCTSFAHSLGRCIKHGGGQRCEVPNCPRAAQVLKRCCKHGGRRTCKYPNCSSLLKSKGYCRKHQVPK